MTTRVRTLNFLPEIFQTKTNTEFLSATLDQLVNPPIIKKIQGYIGSKVGYGVNANDYYVTEPTKTRTDYQLDPGVVFTKTNQTTAQDFISYPGILDALELQGGVTNNNSRLFESEIYSWDSFTDLDKVVNYNQYYWIPNGLPAVTVSSALVYSTNEYIVTDLANGYSIREAGAAAGSTNPTITLLRGGVYRFIVNQPSQFWIQGEPGVSGFSPIQPNLPVRDVFGVSNNGATQGAVTFTVPAKNAQDEYNFPGNNLTDVVSTLPFAQINGLPLSTVGSIDGITSLNGLRVMFYNTGVTNEVGYVSAYYDETTFDTNDDTLVAPLVVTIGSSDSGTDRFTLSSGTTDELVVNNTITFNNPVFGGVTAGTVYYIKSVESSTEFTISDTLSGATFSLTTASGTMTANANQGLYEEGFYTTVNENFYRITYVGDSSAPVIRLIPDGVIPTEQKITPTAGTTWINRPFYRNTLGIISLIPYITAPLDQLYYQDGTSANKVGSIRIVESNVTNTINVEVDILGKKNYTSTNGVVFTNGLKVEFDGDVIPSSYLSGEYYVEGVGTAIELIPVETLITPEDFTTGVFVPFDITPYDASNFDSDLFVPFEPDYITIARNAINKNAWSRSNRWFHTQVVNQTAVYNNNPNITTEFAKAENKAKRPIIEFYPNLKLFNSGTVGKQAVDFIDQRATDALSQVAGLDNYFPDVEVYTESTADIASVIGTSTTITVPTSDIVGTFQVGQYVSDYLDILPINTQITAITTVSTNTVLTVSWAVSQSVGSATDVAIIATDTTVNNYEVFEGARIIFAADEDLNVRNKIYVASLSQLSIGSNPVITLTEALDGNCEENDQTAILRGYNNQGNSFYFDGIEWIQAQEKVTVNQAPLFDVFDENGISFSDTTVYPSTSFAGCKLFSYGLGAGIDDPILGFPVRYSAINNVGDISFDVSLNTDTFDYVTGTTPVTQKVNTGYVFNFDDRTVYTRELGWQTAIAPSEQYQVFQFNYETTGSATFVCDIAALPVQEGTWTSVQVFVNNTCQCVTQYEYTIGANTTTIELLDPSELENNTPVEVLILSNQISNQAYYTIPVNLANNPFNQDLQTVNVGDIRQQYRDIYVNAPGILGPVFGSNNYRDLGNLVPYGTKIIQNSASLVLPGTFLRKTEHNLFDALKFNSNEYVKFKNLLVDTINNAEYVQRYTPSEILDQAMDIITAAKSEAQAFFWSDMLPAKAPLRSNTYTFANNLDTSIYPLTKVYNFASANYNGVLVYLTRTITGVTVQKQLTNVQDYIISQDAPSLTVTLDLIAGDRITVKEYNQTYGSYVPNTPTKLGLYPAYKPEVVLDTAYTQPTYFIKGHDGSYNKLYGSYNVNLGVLEDFRDQGLLEFELRVYNNLKLSSTVPIQAYEVLPGFFRDTDYTYSEFLQMYSESFLNWVGQNRLDYKTQVFSKVNEFTYNYTNAANKLTNTPIEQGYWRGVYQYFYDTTTPNATPWEMLGFVEQPSWWTNRYGPAPYTSDNLILWDDLEQGIIWNNGVPITVEAVARPGLTDIIPVDSAGNLISPFVSIVGNYNANTFQRDWKVGDDAPVELSYRRSSSYPFDLMRLFALMKPANFFNLGVDLDNYKYNLEFNQYLVNNRSHLVISDVEIYGSGTAKTSYINWIVDYEKQLGINATQNITDLLDNLDVRLVYRLAGYSDKNLLKFYVEKGTPNSSNASLLIPDESYSLLLYDNQPFDRIVYSGVVVQITQNGYAVFGNSQTTAYFKTLKPINNGKYNNIEVENDRVRVAVDYSTQEVIVPYGTRFFSLQEVAQFLSSYGAYLTSQGMIFNDIIGGIEVNWDQMVSEFLYWSQTGWEVGSIILLNPSAQTLKIDKESSIVQPLTVQNTNFVLNQNLYPIQAKDMSVLRNGTEFSVTALNQGDTVSYGQFNLSNFEHGIVFDNETLFNDTIYNLITGLRQSRIFVRGTKTAEWNGTINASGFILNQDNIQEWSRAVKYTKGSIVLYKNKYWTALKVIEPSSVFGERDWKETDYDQIQKGLLPNSATRSYESALYYDTNKANLENDADLLGFSLIGYRPRDYLALVDLTDITQINVYQNLIKNKGTRNAVSAFKGANLPQGGIEYDVYENWAIKSGEFGGLLNKNFVEFKVNETNLTGNPAIVSLTNGVYTPGSQQEVPIYSLFNYARPIDTPDILNTIDSATPSQVYPDAGYVNFDDVRMSSYFYSGLPLARDKNNELIPINDFYVRDYAWLANYLEDWDVLTWTPVGRVIAVRSNLNSTATVTFAQPHGLSRLQPLSIINYATNVDGYYVVANVVNLNEVIINLPVATEIVSTGQGIGLTFQSQRVSKPSDINELPLLDTEFVKNTVWVDESTDGSWAVYRKSLNYQYDNEVTKTNSTTFGSAVAYTDQAGYLISDQALGEVYRYAKNSSNAYTVVETLTGGASFGSQIAYAGSTYIISEPTGSPEVHVYVINDSQLSADFLFCQTISAPGGVTNWGSEVSISGDGNWLYISDIVNNKVHTYRKQNILLNAGYFNVGETYIINEVGTTDFAAISTTPTTTENKVGQIFVAAGTGLVNAGSFVVDKSYTINEIGTTDFTLIGAASNTIGVVFTATGVGSGTGNAIQGTGTATQISYQASTIIDGAALSLVSGDNFSKSITTNYYGDTLVVGAPDKDYSGTIVNWGSAYAYSRAVQNIEVQSTLVRKFALAWTPSTHASRTGFSVTGNVITANGSMTGFSVDDPIVFSDQPVMYTAGSFNIGTTYTIVSIGTTDFTLIGAASNTVGISFIASGVGTGTGTATSVNFGSTGIQPNVVYYIQSRSGSTFTIKETRSSDTPITLINGSNLSFGIYVQTSPLYVYRNSVLVQDNNYGVIDSTLVYSGILIAGDIITVSDSKFTYTQTFTSSYNDRVGTQFGYSVDTTQSGSEILIGSPFEINTNNQEGAAYRFTNGGAKFGLVTGVNECNVTAIRPLLINGYLVYIPVGNATTAATAINAAKITNIQAAASADNKLVIQVINNDLTQVNQELVITAVDTTTLGELGIEVYTNTQIITCPHIFGATQFGSVVQFNEQDSVVISAPVATRYEGTTFDFIDDEFYQNDTVFDNNATQFVDTAPNAGAVYMFDYIANYNENLTNIGEFVYAQSVNSKDREYGFNPLYGTALDFNSNVVMIGTPNFLPDSVDGQVTVYENETGIKDWSVYRSSAPVVDIESIQNAQLFSAETNNTLINLDYIDPLQGKLLGSVRQNIDYISSIDPANYNSQEILDAQSGLIWGAEKVGKLWFDTNNVRFVNYHQNDLVYNSKYWGTVFPGSDVAVYTWITSNVLPSNYQGPGTPKDVSDYTVSSILDASNVTVPIYYFWVRNSNIIFRNEGKTLSDTIIESYITNPKNSGIAFFAPLRQNSFAIYNSAEYFNANDTVFHIGYANGTNNDEAHAEYTLIREDFADDFLPGLPKIGSIVEPQGLYDRMLDSLAGVDELGSVVPNIFLPKAVQSGVLARPRQSFFYNRFLALKNYLTYANEILAQYPISEIRPDVSFLFAQGEFYNTPDYWQYINWWAPGFDNNTKSVIQVPLYADLSTLTVPANTIVTVENNGSGKFEVYRYDDNGIWTRIGLENGTIEFNLALWDYAEAKLGFGDNFFDTNPYDEYPSEETRYIVRALNEQIYIEELLTFRNKSLILLFEYIQSESTESQNYLPWLNKTSLVDVSHTIRELRPIEVFQTDNQAFLEGYINEVKPYHVVIKEFVFKYTGIDTYDGDITDFDLPAQYNQSVQQFITPSLVYTNPSSDNQYLDTDDIWQTAPYTQWFQNKGVSLTGQPNYEITSLASYMTIGSSFMFVDNAQGLPINGVIKIGNEQIAYSSVDRVLNLVSGLSRGLNGTTVTVHFPGERIFVDLPEVLVLDGGKGYTEPPRVTAYIDLETYPAPTQEAVLEAVMSLDSVLSINVIDPGQGYMVLPEIRIDPSVVISFTNSNINSILHTVSVYAPNLATGDLVLYKKGETGAGVGKLANNQWYYINVLETTPTAVIAFYTNYSDAINDTNRIEITDIGFDDENTINIGAKASAITAATPIRENNITLRFDRTTYTSQVQDWRAGAYYGSFFAGSYFNSENVSSSSIQLESVLPPIASILASAQGVAFEISDVENDRLLTWSSLERVVNSTISATNAIRLTPLVSGATGPAASGSTIGFYVNMPVKFEGAVVGGLQVNTTYYVKTIIDDTDFTVSLTEGGATVTLTSVTVPAAGLKCLVGEVVDTAILTVNYPGILEVTATQAGTNAITVPLNPTGTGGTQGFYTNIPVFFTGNVFGGIIENEVYYVTTVIDNQTFTISETQDPLSATVVSCSGATDIIVVNDTEGFAVNDPIIFTNMIVAGSSGTAFGNIVAGTTYYVNEVVNATQIKISTVINGGVFDPGTVTAADDTSALVTSQANTLTLSTATGSMTVNVSLPVSPGQVNGQLFTLYGTSVQYPNINTGTNGNLIERTMSATITTVDRIAIDSTTGGTDNFYVNMPVQFDTTIGGLTTATTYYIIEYSGMPDTLNPGEFLPNIEVEVTNTSSTGNAITCDTTESLFVGMPIIFTGSGIGGIVISVQYFIESIIDANEFTISDTLGGSAKTLTNDSGIMVGTGEPYIKVSLTKGGSAVALSSTTTAFEMTQEIITDAVFDVSYVLGGYRAIVSTIGEGYAVNNTITILGADIGGVTPTNNLLLTVNTIDDDGGIIDVICSGTVPGTAQQYYLKVISPNQLAVYSNPLMTVPVSGIGFGYVGFTTTTATAVTASNDRVTVTSSADFLVNDAVVFTGTMFSSAIVLGQTYYIYDKPTSTTVRLTTNPGSVADIVNITSDTTGSMLMTTAGSFALLPEPFYFNQSIVKFNNRVYVCVISNNDDEFIFGKWELLDSGDRRLNAMDRAIGYYQPTVNMPGVDLTQLFTGVTYPNSIYLGNPFAPAQQYDLDVIVETQPFYSTDVDVSSVVWDGVKYVSAANLPNSSAVLGSVTGDNWAVAKLTNAGIGLTDIIYANNIYVMSSTNSATPILRSNDGIVWTTTGIVISETGPQPINIAALSLHSVTRGGNIFVSVGEGIVSSTDTYEWTERLAFSSSLANTLYSVAYANVPAFTGFVAVGKGEIFEYSTGLTETVDTNLIYYSSNGINWTGVETITPNGFYGVASDGTQIVAVGESGVIYYSANGANWLGVNEVTVESVNGATDQLNVTNTAGFAVNDVVRFTDSFSAITAGTSYYIVNVVSSTQVQISTSLGGSVLTLTAGSPTFRTRMYAYPTTDTLRDITYGNGVFIAVGDNGIIRTSSDAITWTTRTSGTTENLNGVSYKESGEFIVVGDNNTILLTDDSGSTWTSESVFVVAPPVYDIQGGEFTDGYAPEELVAGVVTDNLTLTVNTRPGTNWPVTEYAHTGYQVISLEIAPESATQYTYSFDGATQYPFNIFVAVIDGTTELSTTLYEGTDYTIDWITNTIILTTPIAFTPVMDTLRIDVYEVGNGDQLVRSNSKTDPIRLNTNTGFNEIYLNCNYSASIYAGSGAIRPETFPVDVYATETFALGDRIVCDSVDKFVVNSPIYFQGVVFGNIVEDQQYFVKSISPATNSITISDTESGGVAGPVFELTDATGLMLVNIEIGSGLVWTDPIVSHNGAKLVLGVTNTAVKTKSSNNAIVTVSTNGLIVGTTITFCQCMFGNDIDPLTTYYIESIIDGNEFTISETQGGSVKVLGDASGRSMFVTNDYAIGTASNDISAKLVFANQYDNDVDYLVYSIFGETFSVQYGYTVPETELITADGNTVFSLSNFVGGDNATNAIVEVNGLRMIPTTDYIIDSGLDTITFDSAPAANSAISVITFNDTQRQYLNTQVIGDGISTAPVVNAIQSISNEITLPLAVTRATASTIGSPNEITVDSTTGFSVNATVEFKGTSFDANILVDGTIYFVDTIVNSTTFTIKDESGTVIITAGGTGNMQVTVGGTPAVRVTTAAAHGFSENDVVRIDGTEGSVQLNNNTYYAKIIDSTTFDLYETGISGYTGYDPNLGAINYPVTTISAYTGGGYVWIADSYYLVTQIATATITSTNRITVTSTSQLVLDTPVIFTGTVFGNIVEGTTYYVKEVVNSTQFTISATRGGSVFALSNGSGSMNVTQWEQVNTDRLWVTINGYRVPSSSLVLNADNQLSILSPIAENDIVIITSMMPYASPDEEIYLNFVDDEGAASVYRANTGTRTWLTQAIYDLSTEIYVDDVTRLTNTIVQTVTTPSAVSGNYNFGLTADKRLITNVTVFNNTTNEFISSDNYQVVIEELSPILRITAGSYINVGNQLTITTLEGNLILVNGEQIRFGTVDVGNNTLGELERGVNGTAKQSLISTYADVFGLLSKNRLSDVYYNQTWNPIDDAIFNTVDGDPLQISETISAEFLNTDIL